MVRLTFAKACPSEADGSGSRGASVIFVRPRPVIRITPIAPGVLFRRRCPPKPDGSGTVLRIRPEKEELRTYRYRSRKLSNSPDWSEKKIEKRLNCKRTMESGSSRSLFLAERNGRRV